MPRCHEIPGASNGEHCHGGDVLREDIRPWVGTEPFQVVVVHPQNQLHALRLLPGASRLLGGSLLERGATLPHGP